MAMTVEELHKYLSELIRVGKGNLQVKIENRNSEIFNDINRVESFKNFVEILIEH